jgi:hypothetical protein
LLIVITTGPSAFSNLLTSSVFLQKFEAMMLLAAEVPFVLWKQMVASVLIPSATFQQRPDSVVQLVTPGIYCIFCEFTDPVTPSTATKSSKATSPAINSSTAIISSKAFKSSTATVAPGSSAFPSIASPGGTGRAP